MLNANLLFGKRERQAGHLLMEVRDIIYMYYVCIGYATRCRSIRHLFNRRLQPIGLYKSHIHHSLSRMALTCISAMPPFIFTGYCNGRQDRVHATWMRVQIGKKTRGNRKITRGKAKCFCKCPQYCTLVRPCDYLIVMSYLH